MNKHTCNEGNGPYFGRLDPEVCLRCKELSNGAPTRNWNISEAYQMRVGAGPAYERFKQALKAHDCIKRNCGPVCTAFEW